MADERAKDILHCFDQLKAARSNYESYWQEIAERVLPKASNNFFTRSFSFGDKRTDQLLDLTPVMALERFSAATESMLTPRTSRWHRLRASNSDLMRSLRVQRWFETVTEILFNYRYSARANFASQANECYMALGAFGTAAMYIEEPRETGIMGLRYKSEHIGFVYFLEDYQGKIDTCYRQVFLTARQAEQKYGREALPEQIAKELAKPKPDPNQLFEFIHVIRPRGEKDGEPPFGSEGMKYTSLHVARDGQKVVREGGFFTFPMPVSRYVTAPNEVYGRSPAMMALGSIKTLNDQKKTYLKSGHRLVDPVLLAHDDGVLDSFSLRPGAINYGGINAQGQKLVQPLHDYSGSRFAPEFMEMERKDINDVFLVTLFQVLTENPQMTATEVLERVREKGVLLAPTMGRQQSEFLGPLIDRELDILSRQGALPPMPGELMEAAGEYEVEYDSPLARAMRAEEATGFLRYTEFGGLYAQMTGDTGFLDQIDPDEAAPELAWILNVPAKWRRTPEKLTELRQQQQQQKTVQTAIEAAPAAAGLMKAQQRPSAR